MKQKELFFQYYRFSACVDANYDIKESIKDIQQTVQWTLYEGLVENAGTDCGLGINFADRFCG